jgi:hypothetical protein
MTTTQRGSAKIYQAKIYQFPARGRLALGRAESHPAANLTAPNPATLRVANAACGSAWYHETAVQEAEQSRK